MSRNSEENRLSSDPQDDDGEFHDDARDITSNVLSEEPMLNWVDESDVVEDGVSEDDGDVPESLIDLRSTAGDRENLQKRLAEVTVSDDYTFGSSSTMTLSHTEHEDTETDNTMRPLTNIRPGEMDGQRNMPLSAAPVRPVPSVFEELRLRPYQKELVRKAVQGFNSLIIAPTGSGKTHVAMHIAKEHLKVRRIGVKRRKIVFFVPTVALVEQQLQQFQLYMETGCRCTAVSGNESQTLNVSVLVTVSDVIIMTPQILVNALDSKELESLSAFTLLIFDECHRMTGSYPYNTIMAHYYIDVKLADSRAVLPQVVGLTASPGSGSGGSIVQATEHILLLCANMDATEICTVREQINNLDAWINKPTEETTEVRGRLNDPFHAKITQTMNIIEQSLRSRPEIPLLAATEAPDIYTLIQPPAVRGSDPYVQFVSKLKRAIAVIHDQKIRRFFVACIRHLAVYNNALLINADCRTNDALAYITQEFTKSQMEPGSMAFDKTDKWLDTLFKDMQPELQRISLSPQSANPKLAALENTILGFYRENAASQGIVFCRTRSMAAALVNWIKETQTLEQLNPHKLTGAASAENGGMTHSKLEDVLKYFKGGVHKIVVATSVIEEGLDVSKCNYVIRYEHVTNDIARVQARGRARAQDAQFVLVAERGRGNIERDDANRQRELLTNDALKNIYELDAATKTARIRQLMEREKQQRDIDAMAKTASEAQKKARSHDGDHQLRCVKCDELVLWSSDIRVIDKAHHVTVDPEFEQRVVFKPHGKPVHYNNWVKQDKMFCKRCNNDWGIKATYNGVPCCVIKVENLVVVDPYGKNTYSKKWKDVPFSVAVFTQQDMVVLTENSVANATTR